MHRPRLVDTGAIYERQIRQISNFRFVSGNVGIVGGEVDIMGNISIFQFSGGIIGEGDGHIFLGFAFKRLGLICEDLHLFDIWSNTDGV